MIKPIITSIKLNPAKSRNIPSQVKPTRMAPLSRRVKPLDGAKVVQKELMRRRR